MKFPSLFDIFYEDLVVRRKLFIAGDTLLYKDPHFYFKAGDSELFADIPFYDRGIDMTYKIEVVEDYLQVTSYLKPSFFKRLFRRQTAVETFNLDCHGLKPKEIIGEWMGNNNSYEKRLFISPIQGWGWGMWPKTVHGEVLAGSQFEDDVTLIPKLKGDAADIPTAEELLKAGRKLQIQTTEFGKVVWLQYLLWAFMYLYTQATTDLHRLVLRRLLEKVLGLELTLDYSDEVYHLSVGRGGVLQYSFRDTDPNPPQTESCLWFHPRESLRYTSDRTQYRAEVYSGIPRAVRATGKW